MHAALISELPMSGDALDHDFVIDGAPAVAPGDEPSIYSRSVMGDYFGTMGIPLRAGRLLAESDREDTLFVGVVNEAWSRRYFPSSDPIGRRLRWARQRSRSGSRSSASSATCATSASRTATSRPCTRRSCRPRRMEALVGARRPRPERLGRPRETVRRKVHALDPLLPIARMRWMEQVVGDSLTRQRFGAELLSIFAGSALASRASGSSASCGARSGGGARRSASAWPSAPRPGASSARSSAAGSASSRSESASASRRRSSLTRAMTSLLVGVPPTDPATFAAVALLLAARRAARVLDSGPLRRAHGPHDGASIGVITMRGLLQDVRYALRTLSRSPGFTLAAVATLAVGIGANAAIFSLVRGVLLRPLPFPGAERLVAIYESNEAKGYGRVVASPPNYLDWKAESRSFSSMGAFTHDGARALRRRRSGAALRHGGDRGFFETLAVKPLVRPDVLPPPTPSRERPPPWSSVTESGPVASAPIRRSSERRFASMEMLTRSPGSCRPRFGFRRTEPSSGCRCRSDPTSPRSGGALPGRRRAAAPGMPIESAASGDPRDRRPSPRRLSPQQRGLHRERDAAWRVADGAVAPAMKMLLGAVALVTLVACANVANLLLVRGTRRRAESRSAPRSGPEPPLARQLLTESAVLAILGAAGGLALAAASLDAIVRLAPANVPRLSEVRLDGGVLAFTAAWTLVSVALFGLAPPSRRSGRRRCPALRGVGADASAGRRRVGARQILVVTQIALALVLSAGAGLLLRSLARLSTVDPGFRRRARSSTS